MNFGFVESGRWRCLAELSLFALPARSHPLREGDGLVERFAPPIVEAHIRVFRRLLCLRDRSKRSGDTAGAADDHDSRS
jgi:hypothetical protein